MGVLQFEVLEYRLKHEYGCDIVREGLPYSYIRWIENDVGEDFELDDLILTSDTKIVQDIRENYLLIFTSEWNIQWALDKNPKLTLSEFGKSE